MRTLDLMIEYGSTWLNHPKVDIRVSNDISLVLVLMDTGYNWKLQYSELCDCEKLCPMLINTIQELRYNFGSPYNDEYHFDEAELFQMNLLWELPIDLYVLRSVQKYVHEHFDSWHHGLQFSVQIQY